MRFLVISHGHLLNEDIMSLLLEDIGILKDGKKPKTAKPYDDLLVDTVEHFEYITVLDSNSGYRLFYHERCQSLQTLERLLYAKGPFSLLLKISSDAVSFSRGFSSKQGSGTKLSVDHPGRPIPPFQVRLTMKELLRLCGPIW